jgi:hypothetical protein
MEFLMVKIHALIMWNSWSIRSFWINRFESDHFDWVFLVGFFYHGFLFNHHDNNKIWPKNVFKKIYMKILINYLPYLP